MFHRLSLYLGLARASNLPTVWTNALAAWALAGRGFEWQQLVMLAVAGSLLYSGGCTLNDAFDAAWDKERRPDRPIPSGKLSAGEVWIVGGLELIAGLAMLVQFGWKVVVSGALTVLAILLYDWLHKKSAWTVVLMGWCRAQWVFTAGLAAGMITLNGIFHAVALFLFIICVSLTARREALADRMDTSSGWNKWLYKEIRGNWVRVVVSTLIGLFLYRVAMSSYSVSMFSAFYLILPAFTVLGLGLIWTGWARSHMVGGGPEIGIFVGRALAGITLLDAAFACLSWSWLGLWIVAFLPLCLLLQRRIAAT